MSYLLTLLHMTFKIVAVKNYIKKILFLYFEV